MAVIGRVWLAALLAASPVQAAETLRLHLGVAGEMAWEKANGEHTGGHFASPVGMVELSWRPSPNLDLFVRHLSSLPDRTDNFGVNLMGLRVSFGN